MKMMYETPTAEKLEFNYSEMVAASDIKTKPSHGPACKNDGKTRGSKDANCNGGTAKTRGSKDVHCN